MARPSTPLSAPAVAAALAALALGGCAGRPAPRPDRRFSRCAAIEIDEPIVHMVCAPMAVDGSVQCFGTTVVRVRNCGTDPLWLSSVSAAGDDGAVHHATGRRTFVPSHAAHHVVVARTQPGRVTLSARLQLAAGSMDVAGGSIAFEDAGLEVARGDCEAARGTLRPSGVLGVVRCDRPTSDGGRACFDSGECESEECVFSATATASDELERFVFAPWCERGEETQVAVGRCAERTWPFGCRLRLDEPVAACETDAPPVPPMSCND